MKNIYIIDNSKILIDKLYISKLKKYADVLARNV